MLDQTLIEAAKNTETEFKVALLRHGITQREMASMLNANPAQINRAIKGDVSPKFNELREKMKHFLDIK